MKLKYTALGFLAILSWATLALLTEYSAGIPPFQKLATCFAIAFCCGVLLHLRRPRQLLKSLRQPVGAWFLSVSGLFGYHLAYFVALDHAPAVHASLIAYLWPLLIVVLSALLPGERLGRHHLGGAALGFGAAALMITKGESLIIEAQYQFGYWVSLACAFLWSGYSVLNRRFTAVPTATVTGFCAVVALMSAMVHLAVETFVMPNQTQWLGMAALGLGPVGLAFFAWDAGTKHGDIQLLGVLAYSAPLLSTVLLLASGHADWHWSVPAAAILMVIGSLWASKNLRQTATTTH
ncbi:MAG: DMT family transporter [Gammaproteobacteria bacterium]|nr:DMT family transporter [Gammaproteobacteria bacterium]